MFSLPRSAFTFHTGNLPISDVLTLNVIMMEKTAEEKDRGGNAEYPEY
jgi:hypothetical protein